MTGRAEIVANATFIWQTLCDITELERKNAVLGQELAVLVEMTQNCIAERSAKSERLAGFIKTLEAQTESVAKFDERLWGYVADYVKAVADGGMTVVFRDGARI